MPIEVDDKTTGESESDCPLNITSVVHNQSEFLSIRWLESALENGKKILESGKGELTLGIAGPAKAFAECGDVLQRMADLIDTMHKTIHQQNTQIEQLKKVIEPYVRAVTGAKMS